MAEPAPPTTGTPEPAAGAGGTRSKDEVALELMKFIVVTTGYGKISQSSTGFSAKPASNTQEEHADVLLELFRKCRRAISTED